MIHTPRSVSAASACLRPAICFRSPAVRCSPSLWNGSFTRAPILRPPLVWSDWLSLCRWWHCHYPPAIWRIDSVENESSWFRRSLARSHRWAWRWSPGNIFPFLRSPRCGKESRAGGVATIFERHHPAFHFDDASIPLIYLLLLSGNGAHIQLGGAQLAFSRRCFLAIVCERSDLEQ